MTNEKINSNGGSKSSTYISDTKYRSVYNPLLNPLNIHYIAALNGYKRGPLNDSFHYLDMGCGDGTTLNVLAGLFPDAHFTGIDFNKEHIRIARENAAATGLTNIVFHELDFMNLDDNAFPDFDYIVCYGTFSWINEALQNVVCNFTGDKLKQNGLFLIHFAARPGKIQIDPIWHLMRSIPAGNFTSTTERAAFGVDLIQSLKNSGSLFFRQNPLALMRANSLENQDLDYIAHEALTEWQALYHSDVANRMANAGLSFVGSSNPEDNHLETCVPGTFHSLVEKAENTGIRETVIDYIVNRGVRSDIYIKTGSQDYVKSPAIEAIPFGMLSKDNSIQREFKCSSGVTISYHKQIYADIITQLIKGAMTINDLYKVKRMARYNSEDILNAMYMLVTGKQIRPFKNSFSITRTTLSGRLRPATPQIESILRSRINMNEMIFLPSRLSGQCMELEPQAALILSALVYNRKEGALKWILNQLDSAGLVKAGTAQAAPAAQIKSVVLERIEWVKKTVLPTMVGLELFIAEG